MRYAVLTLAIAAFAVAGFATQGERPCQGSPVASCSSSGCHGGGDIGKPGSEQSTWASDDPHANAYRVLFNDESQRIMRNLHRTGNAHEDASCLACHTASTDVCYDDSEVNAKSDGVGCDGCHGPSRNWLTKHYEPGWKSLANKDSLGYRDNRDLVTRIRNCAGCHVGDAKRTVDHDLIAAGHPRLAFEYTRFHFQPGYVKHWKETLPPREFELKAFFIGQVVSLKNALERTQSFAAKGPWPEFSEQSCFSCHHSLKEPRGVSTAPPWQPWYVANIKLLAAATPVFFPGALPPNPDPLDALQKVMASSTLVESDVRAKTTAVLKVIDAWLADIQKHSGSGPMPTALRGHESGTPSDMPTQSRGHGTQAIDVTPLRRLASSIALAASMASDWDVMAAHYLALAAFAHADPEAFADALPILEKLKSLHKYPPQHTSPANFDPAAARREFAALATKLGERP